MSAPRLVLNADNEHELDEARINGRLLARLPLNGTEDNYFEAYEMSLTEGKVFEVDHGVCVHVWITERALQAMTYALAKTAWGEVFSDRWAVR